MFEKESRGALRRCVRCYKLGGSSVSCNSGRRRTSLEGSLTVGRAFLVKIRLDVLRANLSAADATKYTRAQARQWLLDAGFSPAGPWWRVNEADLRLEPPEVAEALPEAEAGARRKRVA